MRSCIVRWTGQLAVLRALQPPQHKDLNTFIKWLWDPELCCGAAGMLETYFSDKLDEFHGKLEEEGEVSNAYHIAIGAYAALRIRGQIVLCCCTVAQPHSSRGTWLDPSCNKHKSWTHTQADRAKTEQQCMTRAFGCRTSASQPRAPQLLLAGQPRLWAQIGRRASETYRLP